MKKLLLFLGLSLAGYGICYGQDNIQEAYFHELRGMEDSTGTTHLFYRLYEERSFQCSEENGGQIITSNKDHISHFNTESLADSVKFRDYFAPWCIDGIYDAEGINDYDFYENDPEKWVISSSYEYVHGVGDYLGNVLNFEIPIAIKRESAISNQDYFPLEFYLSPSQDSLFMDSYGTTIPFPGDGENWPEFINYDDFLSYADSLSYPLEMAGISPEIDSVYFAKDKYGYLYKSTNYSGDFKLADSSGAFTKLAFDADSLVVYSLITVRENSEYKRKFIKSDDLGSENSWTDLSIPETDTRFEFLETDNSTNGTLFLADSNHVYVSLDFGVHFSETFSSEDLITGLYKKPESNILYVLTKEELLEVNTETGESISLKQLPVSNEPEPHHADLPRSIELHQNYPNPFNPVTVIGYRLPVRSEVTLEVFDVTGRRVAVLVDGPQQSGVHQVTFDASNVASGIYFYRLETGEQTLTQKMTLIK